jgi:hypothetical protein
MRSIFMMASVGLLLATGCSGQTEAPTLPGVDPAPVAGPNAGSEQAPADDGLQAPAGNLAVLGEFALWEDREGGLVCPIELESARRIGGHSIVFDEDCVSRLELGGDLHAWFAAEDGTIVLIDATRRVLVRLRRLENGDYYAERGGGLENLNLTRPN